ncbi:MULTISPECIES: DUF4160 domain-containing protein [unclassified Phaeobacter]|uniref:DUF4160 domain-containing protein n=1 Tax=unclassified Phaeobacter TaxID=2621772 RepID=UPI003A853297
MSDNIVLFEDNCTEDLLSSLNLADLMDPRSRKSSASTGPYMDFIVARFRDIKIEIYAKEHPPPHFHVKTNAGNASFEISNCRLIEGDAVLARRQKEIRKWHETNKQKLIATWNETRPSDCPVGKYIEKNDE